MRPVGRIVSSCILGLPVGGLRTSAWGGWCALFHARETVSATDERKNDNNIISQGHVLLKTSIYRGLKGMITIK